MFGVKCDVDGCEEEATHSAEVKPLLKVHMCDKHKLQVRKITDEFMVEHIKSSQALREKCFRKIESLK